VLVGSQRYRILPLHSQIPREDQKRVFEQVPAGVTKVRKCCHVALNSVIADRLVAEHTSCTIRYDTEFALEN